GLPGARNDQGPMAGDPLGGGLKPDNGSTSAVDLARADVKDNGKPVPAPGALDRGPAPVPPIGAPAGVGSPPIPGPAPTDPPKPRPGGQGRHRVGGAHARLHGGGPLVKGAEKEVLHVGALRACPAVLHRDAPEGGR